MKKNTKKSLSYCILPPKIKRAAVLGSGTMGAQIAAHLANAGIPSFLLDMVPQDSPVRNYLATEALERLKKMKPSPLFIPELANLITSGNFEDDLPKLKEVDWIIEAVIEKIDVKQALLKKIDPHRKSDCIVSTNTSGLKISEISKNMSQEFKTHFLGTHFFNPPRYMKLLEIIPTPDTLPSIIETITSIGKDLLGKGIVLCKDTPNFIANRIGTFAVMFTLHEMIEKGYTVEEIDELTGPVIGRPKSATLRTLDLIGLDIFAYVAENLFSSLSIDEQKEVFKLPPLIYKMMAQKQLGEKTSQGFYKKSTEGILSLDLATLTYRPRISPKLPAVEMAKGISILRDRLKLLAASKDKEGKFFWRTTAALLSYASQRIPEISDSFFEIDKGMRWGFGWEVGPFEIWDILGVKESISRIEQEGFHVPTWVTDRLSSGKKNFFQPDRLISDDKKILNQKKIISQNSGATLLHLGDEILCLEFHTKMNTLGEEILKMATQALDQLEKHYEGLVIGNQGEHFSLGANLMLILMLAEEEEWDELSRAVRLFQDVNQRIKYARKPVVAAPHGRALGGGCEMVLHACRAVAHAESYLGLVELSAGLIPAGGGVKEMLCRPIPPSTAFQTIATARVSTSALEAKQIGYLRENDPVVMNLDYHLYEAKKSALALARQEYRPPEKAHIKALGKSLYENLVTAVRSMQQSGVITEYDAHLGKKLAYVVSGGDEDRPKEVDESFILNLEREAFLSLCGEKKSQDRMRHLLKTGKPLRN